MFKANYSIALNEGALARREMRQEKAHGLWGRQSSVL